MYKHLFGPVVSRRLGRSLGVDLVPLKTCSLDCCFCQAGSTTKRTIERAEYVDTAVVTEEIETWLADGGTADRITLSGSGEPTLHSRFGDVLDFIAGACDIGTTLLSNGTLFYLGEVRKAALSAGIVKLSLGAWDQDSFEKLNRPHADLDFERIVAGMRDFRREYDGILWVEVFLVKGINDSPENIPKIAELARGIKPDNIHLNTVLRAPAENGLEPVDVNVLAGYADLFEPRAETIKDVSSVVNIGDTVGTRPLKQQ